MKSYGIYPLILLAYIQAGGAVTVVLCEDGQGNRSYEAKCPPGTTLILHKEYSSTTSASVTIAEKPSLTIYRVPDCATCDQVKEFMLVNNLQFTEMDISMSIELQEKVKQLAGGLQVPVLAVGDKVIVGYNRPAMRQALTDAGHIAAAPNQKLD